MNAKLRLLDARRAVLISAAAQQRLAVAQHIAPWRLPLALADQGLAALRVIKQHPQWWIGGLLLLAALQPQRVGRWLQRSWGAWLVVRRLRG